MFRLIQTLPARTVNICIFILKHKTYGSSYIFLKTLKAMLSSYQSEQINFLNTDLFVFQWYTFIPLNPKTFYYFHVLLILLFHLVVVFSELASESEVTVVARVICSYLQISP